MYPLLNIYYYIKGGSKLSGANPFGSQGATVLGVYGGKGRQKKFP
jgi:hypothetical protein